MDGKDIFFSVICLVAIIIFCGEVILRIIRRKKNIKYVSEEICKSKKRFRGNDIWITFYFVITIFSYYSNAKFNYKWNNNINYEPEFNEVLNYMVSKSFSYKVFIAMIIIFIIFCIISIIIHFLFGSILYKEGMILYSGKLIKWEEIEKIDYKKTLMEYSYIITIYKYNNKKEFFYCTKSEIDKILNVIMEKTDIDIYEKIITFE